ncbi:MAG: rod shape-determining protein [Clostridia bacterium]
MGFLSGGGIAIDLGSSNTTIYLENEGIVLREPTSVLVMTDDPTSVLAVGGDAYQSQGRTGKATQLAFPVMDGAVTDVDLAALTMIALSEKATGRRKPMEKAQLLVSMSQGLTKVEKDALALAVRASGAKRTILVKTPLAAALGAGLTVDQPRAVMIVVLGGGTTEIAVISMTGIVAARSMRTGSLSMDEAIVRYVRRKKRLIIGLSTAEDLKCDIGSATLPTEDYDEDWPEDEDDQPILENTQETGLATIEPVEPVGEKALLKGKNALTGKPETITVSTRDIALALREPVSVLIDAIRDALGRVPPELAADILDSGITLSGGGALLSGLAQLLAEKTGVPVSVGEHPHEDVILGLGRMASDDKLLNGALEAGAAQEQ